ncbi:unnamed protein product [Citrullus colocynthis]|uniref:Uncharacterized protein n=1 Tax=Citrullus colocynthis TaxID=252529 RepID=A0ABP0YCI6_9ROSI
MYTNLPDDIDYSELQQLFLSFEGISSNSTPSTYYVLVVKLPAMLTSAMGPIRAIMFASKARVHLAPNRALLDTAMGEREDPSSRTLNISTPSQKEVAMGQIPDHSIPQEKTPGACGGRSDFKIVGQFYNCREIGELKYYYYYYYYYVQYLKGAESLSPSASSLPLVPLLQRISNG